MSINSYLKKKIQIRTDDQNPNLNEKLSGPEEEATTINADADIPTADEIGEDVSLDDVGDDEINEIPDDPIESIDISQYYTFESVNTKSVKKFKATATEYRLRLRNLDDQFAFKALPLLSAIINDVLQNLTLGIRSRDMVRIILQAPDLEKPIALPFIKKDDLTMDRFMARIEHVLQSKKNLKLDSSMESNFVHMEMPEGGKPTRKSLFHTWEEKKKTLYNLSLPSPINGITCV